MAIVLITGCSSGFGLETALAFARRGDQVVATAREPRRATELTARAAEFSQTRTQTQRQGQAQAQGQLAVERLDVTDQGSIDQAVASTLDRFGSIDVLVNNAGVGVIGALEALDDATLRRVFDTNVFGAVAVTRAVLPHMRQQRSGRVIFMNAIGGIVTTAFLGAYCASKHALDCFAAVFDLELRPYGVRVSSVYPSAFHTAIADNMPTVIQPESPYAGPTAAYRDGITSRILNGPTDLGPVVDAVLDAATNPEPRLRYLVAPHLAEVLNPTLNDLDALHQREMAATPR